MGGLGKDKEEKSGPREMWREKKRTLSSWAEQKERGDNQRKTEIEERSKTLW